MLGGVNLPKTVGFKQISPWFRPLPKPVVLRPTPTLIGFGSTWYRHQPRAARINVNDIIAGNSPDLLLEPRDVIWVPQAGAMHPKRVLQSGCPKLCRRSLRHHRRRPVGRHRANHYPCRIGVYHAQQPTHPRHRRYAFVQ